MESRGGQKIQGARKIKNTYHGKERPATSRR